MQIQSRIQMQIQIRIRIQMQIQIQIQIRIRIRIQIQIRNRTHDAEQIVESVKVERSARSTANVRGGAVPARYCRGLRR